jgi:hypothetical protein
MFWEIDRDIEISVVRGFTAGEFDLAKGLNSLSDRESEFLFWRLYWLAGGSGCGPGIRRDGVSGGWSDWIAYSGQRRGMRGRGWLSRGHCSL